MGPTQCSEVPASDPLGTPFQSFGDAPKHPSTEHLTHILYPAHTRAPSVCSLLTVAAASFHRWLVSTPRKPAQFGGQGQTTSFHISPAQKCKRRALQAGKKAHKLRNCVTEGAWNMELTCPQKAWESLRIPNWADGGYVFPKSAGKDWGGACSLQRRGFRGPEKSRRHGTTKGRNDLPVTEPRDMEIWGYRIKKSTLRSIWNGFFFVSRNSFKGFFVFYFLH